MLRDDAVDTDRRQLPSSGSRRYRGIPTIGCAFKIDTAYGVRKPSSRGSAVFVDESAESVSALDEACRRARNLQLPTSGIGRLQIE